MINKKAGSRQKVDLKGMTVTMTDDTKDFRYAMLEALGFSQKCQAFSPYGLCSNPPDSSLGIVFNIQGIAANKVAIIDDPKNRKKNLQKGEVALVNYSTGAFVYIKEDNTIDIETPSGSKITLGSDGTITITGNLTVNGTVTATDFITPTVASQNIHKHGGVTTGSGSTGVPS